MRARGTLFLLILVVGLGAYIFFHERELASSDERRLAMRRAFQIEPSLVTSLRIQVPAYTVDLKREGDQWRMGLPRGAPAHAPAIRQTLSRLQHMDRGELITLDDMRERGLTLADFGLVVPNARLRVGTAAGTREYLIGNPDPLGRSLYVKEQESQNVILVATELLSFFPADRDAFRDRRLFTVEPRDSTLLSLVTPERKLTVERGTAGWTMLDPVRAAADPEQVIHTLEKIHLARAEAFADALSSDLAAVGLDTPHTSLRLQAGPEGIPQELWIGHALPGDPDKRYARNPRHDGVLVVSAGLAHLAGLEVEFLRERRLLPGDPAGITAIRIESPQGPLRMRRPAGGEWILSEPVEMAASQDRVRQYLDAWRDARVESFQTGATSPVEVAYTVAFERGRPPPELPLRFEVLSTPAGPGRLAIRANGSPEILVVVPDTLKHLPHDGLHFRASAVLRFDPRNVIRVSAVSTGLTTTVTRVSAAEPWLAFESDRMALPENLERLLSVFSVLDARQWKQPDPGEANRYGMREPLLRLSVGVGGDPPMSRTLILGTPQGEGEFHGRIQGQDLVFSVDPEAWSVLRLPICQAREASDVPATIQP